MLKYLLLGFLISQSALAAGYTCSDPSGSELTLTKENERAVLVAVKGTRAQTTFHGTLLTQYSQPTGLYPKFVYELVSSAGVKANLVIAEAPVFSGRGGHCGRACNSFLNQVTALLSMGNKASSYDCAKDL